jgi:hypothetical protein
MAAHQASKPIAALFALTAVSLAGCASESHTFVRDSLLLPTGEMVLLNHISKENVGMGSGEVCITDGLLPIIPPGSCMTTVTKTGANVNAAISSAGVLSSMAYSAAAARQAFFLASCRQVFRPDRSIN